MNLSREAFVALKRSFTDNLNASACDDDFVSRLNSIFTIIEETGELPNSFGESTDDFLDKFCAPVLLRILDTYASNFRKISKIKEVLNNFSCLFSSLIVRPSHDSFINDASPMYFVEDSKIYSSTKPQNEGKMEEFETQENDGEIKPIIPTEEEEKGETKSERKHSEYFESVFLVFSNEKFFPALENFLKDHENVTYERMIFLMKLFRQILDSEVIKFDINKAVELLIDCLTEKSKVVDDENDDIYNQATAKIKEFELTDEQKQKIEIAGLEHAVKSIINKNNDIAEIIQNFAAISSGVSEDCRKLLSDIIKDTHFVANYLKNAGKQNPVFADTVRKFVSLVEPFIDYGLVSDTDFENLWNATTVQDEETIQEFLKSWRFLLRNKQDYVASRLFKAIVQCGQYSETILAFLLSIKNIPSNESKLDVFRQISELYFETDGSSELYVPVICAYLPTNDEGFLKKMQNRCIKFINSQENVELAVPLLKATINSVTNDEAKEFFNSVSSVANPNALPLISKLISFFSGELENEEFEKLNEMISKLAGEHMKEVCDFLLEVTSMSVKHFSQEMMLKILETVCSQETVAPTVSLVSKIYSMTEKDTRMKFIDTIWECLFKTGSPEISEYMVKLFVTSPDPTLITTFIDKCADHMETPGALISLVKIIHFVEDGVDRNANKYLPFNQFVSDEECVFINLIGVVKARVRVPRGLSFQAFKDRVSSIIRVSNQAFSLIAKDVVVTIDNFELTDNSTFEVKVWKQMPFKQPIPPIFPSQILSQEKYSSKLFNIMNKNDDVLSPLALAVLNLMPTLESQNQILRTFGSTPQQWAAFLSFKQKYLMLYRLNLIGSIVQGGHNEWINFLYSTGGAKVLLGIIVFMARKIFQKEADLLFLLRVAKIVVVQPHWEQYKKDMWSALDANSLTAFIQFALDFIDSESILTNLMVIMTNFDINALKDLPNFVDLFNATIFHESKDVRAEIAFITKQLTPQKQAKMLMPLLSESISKPSDKFFDLLYPIAEVVDNPEALWEPVVELLFTLFYPPQTDDNLEKLMYEPADASFAQRLFVLLDKLSTKFEKIPDQKRLCAFLISDILFNGIKYYEPTHELFSLITKILAQNNEFREPIVQKLALTQQVVQTIPPNAPELQLAANCRNRGIINMGATSYLSSVLQQLFGVKQFLKMFLSLDTNINWVFELQVILCELMFSPSKSVSPYRFVNTWKDKNGVPINVNEYGDASDFFKKVIRMISESTPQLAPCFRGKMRKYVTRSDDVKTEPVDRFFTIIPLDITMCDDLETSLRNYLGASRSMLKEDDKTIDCETVNKVRKAPKVLVIQLKRIMIDTKTGRKVKLNKEFKYPFSLDISDLLDGPLKQAEYDLCGIITHNGMPEHGMYESYVKQSDGTWINFNDHRVEKVEKETLLNDTLGGVEMLEFFNDATMSMVSQPFEKSKSGYMFFYKKRYWSVRKTEKDEIHPKVIESVMTEMRQNLFKAVSVSPEYTKLVLNVSDSDEDGTFLYRNLMTYTGSDNMTIEIATPLVNKFVDNLHNSSKLCEFVLAQQQDTDELLIHTNNPITRSVYSKIIVEAMKGACNMRRDLYIEHLVTKIVTKADFIASSWSHLDEFFLVIDEAIALDVEERGMRFFEILLNFIRVDIPQYSMLHPNENVIANINVTPLFSILTKTLANQARTPKITQSIFTKTFFETWLKPFKHSLSFGGFISEYIGSSKEIAGALKTVISISAKSDMTKLLAAAFLTLSITLHPAISKSIADHVLSLTVNKSPAFKRAILEEVCDRVIKGGMSKKPGMLRKVLLFLIPYIFAKSDTIREGAERFADAILPLTKEKTPEELHDDLVNAFLDLYEKLPDVVKEVKVGRQLYIEYQITREMYFRAIPTRAYFFVLSRIIIKADLFEQVAELGDSFVDAMIEFSYSDEVPNIPLQNIFDFLMTNIHDSKAFFAKASFKSFIKSLAYFRSNFNRPEQLCALLKFIPEEYAEAFIKSDCFPDLLKYFMIKELHDYVVDHINANNAKNIAKILWCQQSLMRMVKTGVMYYFTLSWEILMKFPEVSSVFYSDDCQVLLYQCTRNLTAQITRPVLKVLAEFNNSFYKVFKDAKSFFGSKIASLTNSYVKDAKINFNKLVGALTIAYPDTFAKTGVADFVSSLIPLSVDMRNSIFTALTELEKPLLQSTPPELQDAHAHILEAVCDLKYNGVTASLNLLASEMKYAIGDSLEKLAALYYFIHTETGESGNIMDTIDFIMTNAGEVVVYKGSVERIALEIAAEAGAERVNKWVKRMADIITIAANRSLHVPLGNDAEMFIAAVRCAEHLKKKVEFEMPKIDVNKNEFVAEKDKEKSPEKVEFLGKVIAFLTENEASCEA